LALPHTPAGWAEAREIRQAPPLVAFTLAAFLAVMIFLPPEGRIGTPLHDGLVLLLGKATFMLPVALVVAGVLLVVRELRPSTPLPRRRLAGTGLLAVAVLPSEHLLANADDGAGLIGKWLSTWLLDLLGGPGTLVLLVAVLGLGVLLAFDVKLLHVAAPVSGLGAAAHGKDAES
jgi:hypothetical protein